MREVESQLVRADVRAGLADVRPEPPAERGVQQMRGGVVALGGVTGCPVDVCADALARPQLAALGHDRDDLVVAEAHHVVDAGEAVAVGALDEAGVRDLAAAGSVERRLDQLDQHAAVLRRHGADRRLAVGRLVADEVGREAGRAGEGERPLAQLLVRAVPPRALA